MSIVETWRAGKATRNVGYSVANCQERTAAVYAAGIQKRAKDRMTEKEACF
jgi:hypothetical protein